MDLKDLEENVRVRVGAADKVSAERLRVCTRMMSVHGNCHFSLNPGLSSTFFFFFSVADVKIFSTWIFVFSTASRSARAGCEDGTRSHQLIIIVFYFYFYFLPQQLDDDYAADDLM